jgi:hypothetical protein
VIAAGKVYFINTMPNKAFLTNRLTASAPDITIRGAFTYDKMRFVNDGTANNLMGI